MVDDVLMILDDIGASKVFLLGMDEGGQIGVLLAASHPERLEGLLLYGMSPSGIASPDMPWVLSEEEMETWISWVVERYGSREVVIKDVREDTPSRAGDEAYIRWVSKMWRYAASPSSFVALYRLQMRLDISDVLPTIGVPTLVVHPRDDRALSVDAARFVSQAIPDASLVELEGEDHFLSEENAGPLVEVIRGFVGEARERADPGRRLATVLFTDIVGSTQLASELGDEQWRDVLAQHDVRARDEVAEFRGEFIHTTGDGLLAAFDGPARAVRCAWAIAEAVRPLGLEIRAGLHTGEVEMTGDEIQGIAVHIGARVAALASESEILVSSTVRDLVAGSGLVFEDAGEHELKGVPDRWHLYRVIP